MLGIDGLKRATAETSPYATGNLGAPVLAAMQGRACQESVGVVGIINESAFGCAGGGIRFDDAVEHVLSLAPSRFRAETVPLVDCAGRVIAAPFEARLGLPGFDRSAMDGYAVSCADLKAGAWLPTIGRTAAGEAPGRLCPNSAHRIMTGASVPDGADAVIAQENVYSAATGMCARSLLGNREISWSASASMRAALVRVGKARSRSRRCTIMRSLTPP